MSTHLSHSELEQVLEYLDSECIGVESGTGKHGFNYDKAKAKLLAWGAAQRKDAEISVLKRSHVDQGEIYVKFDTGFCEQYEYIKQLESQSRKEG